MLVERRAGFERMVRGRQHPPASAQDSGGGGGVSAVDFRAKQSRSSSCCLRISKVIKPYLEEPASGEELLFTYLALF